MKSDDIWIDFNNYKTGKITDVDGKWSTQAFCGCGNELIHSNSFLQERETGSACVFDYKCSNCGETQHWNPDVIPGLIKCDIDGKIIWK